MVFGLRFRRGFKDFKDFSDFSDFKDFKASKASKASKDFSDLRVGEGEWEFGVLWPLGRVDWSIVGADAVKEDEN